jgi:hypothetical protein
MASWRYSGIPNPDEILNYNRDLEYLNLYDLKNLKKPKKFEKLKNLKKDMCKI